MESKNGSGTLRIVQVNGADHPGIFVHFCQFFSDNSINILDVKQNVLRGYLSITFLVDLKESKLNEDRIALQLRKIGRVHSLNVDLHRYEKGQRARLRDLYVLTIVGRDQIGLLHQISAVLTENKVNIDTIQVKVNEGFIYNQFLIDCSSVTDIKKLRNDIRQVCEAMGLSMTLQQERLYRKNKKLIIFDMDSTLINGETIVEAAKLAGKEQEMAEATELAMSTDMDFSESLIQRARLLQGIPEAMLKQIANNLELTFGAEELISELKAMGWKIGIVSSGFSYFTDAVKEKLGLDYSFGNTLEIRDGIVTGNITGSIIDANGKWEIVQELAHQLNIHPDEVVTIGDGSNDISMIKNSGLGIGFNSKEILSEVADGKIGQTHLKSVLLMLGLSETEIDQFFYQSNTNA
ncbi:MAG: phosphoserine phosphatase SerB [Methanobacteriota archaeon]|nr:MAG: phosphoserine phosphatase SerB [Euryarchaeota archaeon]